MKNGAYAGLRMAARAASPDPEQDPTEIEPEGGEEEASAPKDRKQKDKKPMDTNCNDDAVAQAVAAERTRTNTVLASEHYAGREKLAANLLSTGLSADEIVTALVAAEMPIAAAADPAKAEDAALTEMREAIDQNANSALDANVSGGGEGANGQANNFGWGEIHAEIQERRTV